MILQEKNSWLEISAMYSGIGFDADSPPSWNLRIRSLDFIVNSRTTQQTHSKRVKFKKNEHVDEHLETDANFQPRLRSTKIINKRLVSC